MEPGLEILRIDGIPARRYAEEEVLPYQNASTAQGLEMRTFGYALLFGPKDSRMELTLKDERGEVFTRSLARTGGQTPDPLLKTRMLRGEIAYVTLNSFASEVVVSEFDSVFASIENAAALIIDLRDNHGGNSSYGYEILGRLAAERFSTTPWRSRRYVPTFRAWGMPPSWYRRAGSSREPGGDRCYEGPVILLVGPQTASAAEDFCVVFRGMERGTIVGEPTYGSTGQPLIFRLPGGGSGYVCAKHDTYPDGTEYVGVGVQPDIVVSPTVADIRVGRDPVLDRALDYLSTAPNRLGDTPTEDE
jgi:C-terminal processing protease CtpA/Prc